MVLDYFLPANLKYPAEQNNLRALIMVGFSFFYLLVLCPLFFFSLRSPFSSFYGMIFVIGTLAAGAGSLLFLKRTGAYRQTALFLCTWCVGASILLSLEAEAVYTPSLAWLPFLLSFMALLGGLRGSLAFFVLSTIFLLAFFLIAPRFSLPTTESWPHWNRHLLMHIVLSQMAYYAVIYIFEMLREADNSDLQAQKHQLMQSAKVQSTRSLNRLMEKKLLACADLNRQTLATLQKNPGRDSKINSKSLEILQQQLDHLCQMADQFLDESLRSLVAKDFMSFFEELLLEDPAFRSIDFQFKSSLEKGRIMMPFHTLYPLLETSLERMIQPWHDVPHLRVMIEGERQGEDYAMHLNAYVPQGSGANRLEMETEGFASLPVRHELDITPTLVRLTLYLPYRA